MFFNRFRQFSGLSLSAAIFAASVDLPAMAQESPGRRAAGPRLSVAEQSVPGPAPVVQKIEATNTRVEMTVNGSRILSMDKPIPTAQVANPELLDFTVISENKVQIHAKKAGITSVNLWDEDDKIHTVDVMISGDVRELDRLLRLQYPTASIKLIPTAAGTLLIFGYVDRPDYVDRIMRIAEDYYPKVLNNMTVGGSQQVLLRVKVMQVSRTKLRNLGMDLMDFAGASYGGTTAAGLITKATATAGLARTTTSFTSNGAETLQGGILSGGNQFITMIEALKQDDILKVLAEPTLVTVSGRPASCNVGGEVAYPQPTGFGNISVAFRPFGTQIDFVPIVLGNGSVRLEVRPRVSEVDPTLGTTINGTSVPGFRVREADTGVEMKFGQTLAIAGLLSQETEHSDRGVPYLMDVPYLGALFRRSHDKVNEIELLILVSPELVEALDPDQVPPCAPGMSSLSPDDCGEYFKGYREVPVKPPGMMGPSGSNMMQEQVPVPPPSPAGDEVPSARWPSRSRGTVVVTDAPAKPRVAADSARRPTSNRLPATASARVERYNPSNPQIGKAGTPINPNSAPPGFIGPIGYDVKN
jgi:pilus assembly protein CpaC